MGLELEKRSEVLEFSLNTEEAVNSLLLVYLSISDKSTTKLFGNKAGISFKSKIDLLYDIDVLSKEEHSSLELQMIFRNKFLHDIQSNSFLSVLKHFDNGIKNRFKKFLEKDEKINNEESCRMAYRNLYLNNTKVIKLKFANKRKQIEEKADVLQTLLAELERVNDLSFSLIDELLQILESTELENPKIADLSDKISLKCIESGNSLKMGNEMLNLGERLKIILTERIEIIG